MSTVISVWQPWASLIVGGVKMVETRSRPSSYRGVLLIHASQKWTADLAGLTVSEFRNEMRAIGHPIESGDTEAMVRAAWGMPLGAILGAVEMTDCVPVENVFETWEEESRITTDAARAGHNRIAVREGEKRYGDYTPGRWAYYFSRYHRFDKPVPYRGKQGFFKAHEFTGFTLPSVSGAA